MEEGELTNDMFGEPFYYSSLSKSEVIDLFKEVGFQLEYSIEDFVERNDHRDWVVLARKSSDRE